MAGSEGSWLGESVIQPKFNFGDRVKSLCTHKPFTIDKIEQRDSGEYAYFGKDYTNPHGCLEYVLELYQEPQKKKLYAYEFRDGEGVTVKFYKQKLDERVYSPCPEYDIEYPEGK